ncbi:hypothetical protein M0802_007983 [Mischocyttarus mexicanus]|nr:hypothetical protein M0802_007983 [Mischocyttarus mexicanus]
MSEKMGLTKQYLRYVSSGNMNLIASSQCNVIFVRLEKEEGRFVAAGACEHINIWDLKINEKVQVLIGEKAVVTRLVASPDKQHIAAGYNDGIIKIYDLASGENISSFSGHSSEITTLSYDRSGHRLASGSMDTDIIVWDVIADKGICRLKGHKGVVTEVVFVSRQNILISSSKDHLIKFWDLDTEHNFRTLLGHRSEVWGLALLKYDEYLITGSNDNEIRIWKLSYVDTETSEDNVNIGTLSINEDEKITNTQKHPLRCKHIGSLLRNCSGRVVSLQVDPAKTIIACYGVNNTVEFFHILEENEAQKNMVKRQKKEKKNKAEYINDVDNQVSDEPAVRDMFKRLSPIKVSHKIKGLDLVVGKGGELRVCVGIYNNSIDLYSLLMETKEEATCLRSIKIFGHRTNVQVVCFSSDSLAFITASSDSIKLWNRPSLTCIRTIECQNALTAVFAPGDRYFIVGLKDGSMVIIDGCSGEILESIPAHAKELRSITLFPDLEGVASGGADKNVHFWTFIICPDFNSKTNVGNLSLKHKGTLKLEEGVLCVRISPNYRYVAVSLMDCTVKIFLMNTFKFFISLYSHSQPVTCMDISSDSTLIATGSSDRTIKIWGLDYGDCHKSILAHDGSVTGLLFIPKTHYIFSCGKDGKIKQWDADIYQKIVTLQGHAGEAWNCAISPNGVYVVSCGSDKVIRLYEKTAEPLVLQDEAEEERERAENELMTGETSAVQGQKTQLLPSKKTVNSEKAAELILECLEVTQLYSEELLKFKNSDTVVELPPFMQAYDCKTREDCFLEILKCVKASDLEEALLLLPFSSACEILQMIPRLLKNNFHTELLTRLTICLIEAHHGPILSNQNLLRTLEEIKPLIFKKISTLRDIVGYNLHCMLYIKDNLEKEEGMQFFKDATQKREKRNKIRKNKQKALKRAIMSL